LKRYVLRPDSFLARLIRQLHYFRFLLLPSFLLLLFLFLTQLIFLIIGYFFPQIRVVDWGTVEHGQWVKVLAVRQETVLRAPFNGELNLLVEEGTRVRAGEPLAEVINADYSRSVKKDGRLALRTIAWRLYSIDQEVLQLEKDLQYLQNQTYDLEGQKEQLRNIMATKSELLRTRENLIRTGNSFLSDWTENYQLVLSETPGIFSTKLDGGEELDILETNKTNDLFSQVFKANEHFTEKIKAGKPWAKIIGGYTQTLACKLPAGVNLDPPEEAILHVGGERFPLSFVATDYTNKHWFFTENSLDPQLLNKRTFSAYLIYRRSTGFRVPSAALNYQEQTGWTVITSVKGDKYPISVEVIDKNDQWAIVKGLPIGTAVFYR